MQKYLDYIVDDNGRPLNGINITVYATGTLTKSTIYSDNGITTTTNPVATNPAGYFQFYAADGRYDITISGSGVTTQTLTDVLLEDPADGSAAMAAASGASLMGFQPYGTASNITVQDYLRGNFTAAAGSPTARGFWRDVAGGVNIHRLRDRVFIGAATDNDGLLTNVTKDWLETERVSTTNNTNVAILSTIGQTALLAGSRTSDFTTAGSEGCIGGNFWAVNNNSTQVQSAYALYCEARRKSGAGTTHAFELDIVNEGSVVSLSPTSMSPAGITPGLWVASGGGVVGATTASCAIGILDNGAQFEKGIVFESDALSSNEAISLGRQHAMVWYNAAGNLRAKLRSDAAADSFAVVFEDGRLSIKSIAETELFAMLTNGSFQMKAANCAMEMGDTGSANTPFIDFHSSGNNIDYDARIIASGGTGSTGQAVLTYIALRSIFSGDVEVSTAGKGLRVKEGSNAKQGASVLVAGTVTVANTSVTANSRILLTSNADGGTPGWLRVSARVNGTSFTITSSDGADTSTVAWQIFEPA